MLGISKEALIDFMTPFAAAGGVIVALVCLVALWVVFTSESGSIKLDVLAVDMEFAAGDEWFTVERMWKKICPHGDPFHIEMACRFLLEKGKLLVSEAEDGTRQYKFA